MAWQSVNGQTAWSTEIALKRVKLLRSARYRLKRITYLPLYDRDKPEPAALATHECRRPTA